MKSGDSALFVVVPEGNPQMLEQLKEFDGILFNTELTPEGQCTAQGRGTC